MFHIWTRADAIMAEMQDAKKLDIQTFYKYIIHDSDPDIYILVGSHGSWVCVLRKSVKFYWHFRTINLPMQDPKASGKNRESFSSSKFLIGHMSEKGQAIGMATTEFEEHVRTILTAFQFFRPIRIPMKDTKLAIASFKIFSEKTYGRLIFWRMFPSRKTSLKNWTELLYTLNNTICLFGPTIKPTQHRCILKRPKRSIIFLLVEKFTRNNFFGSLYSAEWLPNKTKRCNQFWFLVMLKLNFLHK